ncbi:hypothetical protein FOVSG1_013376 [Fusarium oxysporum f. sp. vasinfectum]
MNANMANMNAVDGPVGDASVPMMNNSAVAPQAAPRQLQVNDKNRTLLNTYIYECFLRYGMFACACAILNTDKVKVQKHGPGSRHGENKNLLGNGLCDDPMDTDSKENMESKRRENLPTLNVPTLSPDSSFLYEWFCLFWDMFNAPKSKDESGQVNQCVNDTQQNMWRQGYNITRAAMVHSRNNPQAMQMLQKKQRHIHRDPSDMDANRKRPSSRGSTDDAPSRSKRPHLDQGGSFNPNQGGMVPNSRPAQGMPGRQIEQHPNTTRVEQILPTNDIDPTEPNQFHTLPAQSPAVQAKTIATYVASFQQHRGSQKPNEPRLNVAGSKAQGTPVAPQAPDGTALNVFYNPGEMGSGDMQPQPPGSQAGGGSSRALQECQMQLMSLEPQNKKRIMISRQEQDMNGMPRNDGAPGGLVRPGAPGGPPGPNPQLFQSASPDGARPRASTNPADQMKPGIQQMHNASMGSPPPKNTQSCGSPNLIHSMANQMDPNMVPHFVNAGVECVEGNTVAAATSGGMRPLSSHLDQQFSGQMKRQQMMAAQAQGQQQQQTGQSGLLIQWQAGPNGNQMPQAPQGQVQGTPQQRSMPPPSARAIANKKAKSRRTTSSPQTTNAAPTTPSQSNKAVPKKKGTKNVKSKQTATRKQSNSNLNSGATPAAGTALEPEPPTLTTPITPVNQASLNQEGRNTGPAQVVPTGLPAAPAPPAPAPVAPRPHADPTQNVTSSIDDPDTTDFGSTDFANPLTSVDILNDFDFDSLLHGNADETGGFHFNAAPFDMDTGAGEIGAN